MSPSVVVSLVILAIARPAPSPGPVRPPVTESVWGPDVMLHVGYGGKFGMWWGEILPAPGGDLYAYWHEYYSNYISRVTRAGALVFQTYGDYYAGPQGVTVDGAGGVIETIRWGAGYPYYRTPDIAFRRTTPAGAPEPRYDPPYPAHLPTSQDELEPAAATDPTGGAYVAWTRSSACYVQRVTVAGGIAPGWNPNGRRIPSPAGSFFGLSALLPDESGGVYLLASGDVVRAWRIRSDTTLAAGWPAGGLALSAASFNGTYPGGIKLVAGAPGHTFAVWDEKDPGNLEMSRLAGRSFDADGNLDGPVFGISPFSDVATRGNLMDLPSAESDDQGGMLVQWKQADSLRFVRVLANGTVLGPFAGKGSITVVTMRPDGSFLVIWGGPETIMWAQQYLADGTPVPEPRPLQTGYLPLVRQSFDVYPVAAHPDGDGGAFVLFNKGPDHSGAYMMHVPSAAVAGVAAADAGATNGTVAAGALPLRGAKLALAVTPNPARGELRLSLTLSGEQSATIELLDVTGRRLLTQTLPAGAGSVRDQRLALPSGLSSGVYFVRLRQGSQAALQRVAIIR